MIAVSIYEQGSLLPLSISSREAVFSLRPSFFERSIEKTEAASVELITEPISILSSQSIPKANLQNNPVIPAVAATPTVDKSTDFTATGFASLQRVPKPP